MLRQRMHQKVLWWQIAGQRVIARVPDHNALVVADVPAFTGIIDVAAYGVRDPVARCIDPVGTVQSNGKTGLHQNFGR